ncbi:bifunctional uridylyltransferase/uridylyl-removing protein GlnD [soil metagenome]
MGEGIPSELNAAKSFAARSSRSRFLLPEETLREIARVHLKRPAAPPDGKEEFPETLDCSSFSRAVEAALIESFTNDAESKQAWEKAKPIALGSWARGQLCPKSDLDLLFVGDEEAAALVTRRSQEAGIKIRSRVPEDFDDWTKGVEAFDVLALLAAKPLTASAHEAFEAQMTNLKPRLAKLRRGYFSKLKNERRERNERFDSIANFLEPNLKYGPGGLRDMGQAFQLRRLFPERFTSAERQHALQVFEYYRRFFLMSRICVQLSEGGGDLLNAHEQSGVAKWFGFESSRDFMREIQKGLSRVSFYSDVDFEYVNASAKALARLETEDLEFTDLAAMLEREPTPLVQAKARDQGFKLYRSALRKGGVEKQRAEDALGRLLWRAVDPLQGDEATLALFRSRWIDLAVTDFKKIVGYVQHDQYHRYTVDAHLMQAIREMKRVAQRPTLLGRLSILAKELSKEDWKILGWTALYHDVGKGSGGDHSDKSVVIARADLEKWGVPEDTVEEIIWLIENHLELSMAAFRGNPAHPSTWRRLHAKGIEGKRLSRLAIFTAVDIRATNREAYTPWKERLLHELVQYLNLPEAKGLAKLQKALTAMKRPKLLEILDRLDPFLVAAIPTSALAKDLVDVATLTTSASKSSEARDAVIYVKVLKLSKSNRVWVRFQTSVDRARLFARMARTLQMAGLSVRHASIISDTQVGVYDWFEVKPPHQLKGLVKGLESKLSKLIAIPIEASSSVDGLSALKKVEAFDDIECLAMNDDEWVISFRGRDSRGALLRAVDAIASEGLSISWAKVHTWGRQIDDVFGVVPAKGLTTESLLEKLKSRVGRP